MITANLKLGQHRGAPRLWIEGGKLAAAGFSRGDRYELVTDTTAGTLTITASANGSHLIAGRTRRGKALPIIDRHDIRWGAMFPSGRVHVEFTAGVIVVSRSETITLAA